MFMFAFFVIDRLPMSLLPCLLLVENGDGQSRCALVHLVEHKCCKNTMSN